MCRLPEQLYVAGKSSSRPKAEQAVSSAFVKKGSVLHRGSFSCPSEPCREVLEEPQSCSATAGSSPASLRGEPRAVRVVSQESIPRRPFPWPLLQFWG